ncbi:MAG: RNA-binding S4 domain-containing protein [Pseudomonadota bacterium]
MVAPFDIHTVYIKLDSFLKAVNAVASGGEAKLLIADGRVWVNGAVELRRGRKLYPGDGVKLADQEFRVERAA